MENIKVKFVDFPCRIHGLTTYFFDNGEVFYTIFLNSKLNRETQTAVYQHELSHIVSKDFDSMLSVSRLETMRHKL